eukprot:Ihof_evm21s18 gene=Ihof_evmTU21s18
MARQISLNCSGHTRPVVDLAFSEITQDGYFMISACKDGKPMIRNGQTGDWVGTLEGHKGAVWCAKLNSGATRAITGSADFSAKVWNAVTGAEMLSYSHKHIVKAVDYSKDDKWVLTASNEKIIRMFDVESGKTDEVAVFKGHTGNIKQVLFSGTDKVFSAGEDKVIRVWDVRSHEQVQEVEIGGSISSMELSPDGSLLTVTSGKTVSLWQTEGFNKIKSFDMSCQVNSASLHPEKKRFVCGGEDFYLHVFDYETMEEKEVYKGHHGPVHAVRYSPDGMLYASGSEDGTVRLWQDQVGTEYGL